MPGMDDVDDEDDCGSFATARETKRSKVPVDLDPSRDSMLVTNSKPCNDTKAAININDSKPPINPTPANHHSSQNRARSSPDSVDFDPSTPFFYFYHIVDPSAATLTVQVIGPNLTHTFHHARARQHVGPAAISSRLARKTTGFLALSSHPRRRTVLAWAESGHGASPFGDLLDSRRQPGVLSNEVWTRRVVGVGALLGLSMEQPFDTMGMRAADGVGADAMDRLRGVFLGSHVEVKLAVHAVYVLLRIFGLAPEADLASGAISRRQLRRLRAVR